MLTLPMPPPRVRVRACVRVRVRASGGEAVIAPQSAAEGGPLRRPADPSHRLRVQNMLMSRLLIPSMRCSGARDVEAYVLRPFGMPREVSFITLFQRWQRSATRYA